MLNGMEMGRHKGNFTALYNYLKGKQDGCLLLLQGNRTSRNGLSLHHRRFRMKIRKKFFTEKMVKHWNRLSKELVGSPPWKCLRNDWTGIWCLGCIDVPVFSQRLDLEILEAFPNLNNAVILTFLYKAVLIFLCIRL